MSSEIAGVLLKMSILESDELCRPGVAAKQADHSIPGVMSTSTSFKNRNLLAVIGDEVLMNACE